MLPYMGACKNLFVPKIETFNDKEEGHLPLCERFHTLRFVNKSALRNAACAAFVKAQLEDAATAGQQ